MPNPAYYFVTMLQAAVKAGAQEDAVRELLAKVISTGRKWDARIVRVSRGWSFWCKPWLMLMHSGPCEGLNGSKSCEPKLLKQRCSSGFTYKGIAATKGLFAGD